MLVNPELTPMDDLSDNYPLARSRLLFKALARELITVVSQAAEWFSRSYEHLQDNDNVTRQDQCTWAALSGALSPLLTHAGCSEDRLWSFVSCAVDARLDDEIVKTQNIQDEAVVAMRHEEEEVPKDVASIFSELGNVRSCNVGTLFDAYISVRGVPVLQALRLFGQRRLGASRALPGWHRSVGGTPDYGTSDAVLRPFHPADEVRWPAAER